MDIKLLKDLRDRYSYRIASVNTCYHIIDLRRKNRPRDALAFN
jgi:hypothetical protein